MFGSGFQCVDYGGDGGSQAFMFPEPHDGPVGRCKRLIGDAVSVHIPSKLRGPVPVVRCRHAAMVRANVPEASIHKDGDLAGGEDDIWPDLHRPEIDPEIFPVAIPHPVELGAESDFRLGVGTAVGTHVPRAALVERRRVDTPRVRILPRTLRVVFRHGSVDSYGVMNPRDDTFTRDRCSWSASTGKAAG